LVTRALGILYRHIIDFHKKFFMVPVVIGAKGSTSAYLVMK
jgi:hypothetical protein